MKPLMHLFAVLLVLSACSDTPGPQQPAPVIAPDAGYLKNLVINPNGIPDSPRVHLLDSILKTIAADSLLFTATAAGLSKPFGNPNSPYRNEKLFITILQQQIASPWYIKEQKLVFSNKLKLAMQNRAGERANNFRYYLPDGKSNMMYDISSPLLLIYFYNPECHACVQMKDSLHASKILDDNIKSGKLKLLAIYPDPDTVLWKRHLCEYPTTWIHGRDQDEYLWKNKMYDLSAIPTIYLLDSNKNVLIKDAGSISGIERLFVSHFR